MQGNMSASSGQFMTSKGQQRILRYTVSSLLDVYN